METSIARTGFVPGMQLGRYELLRQLAIGGMAEVYLARATGIEGFRKLVVLKRILPQFAHDPSFVEMFLDEARLAARLQHPNIVQVFDVGASVGDYYIAMEYVDGKDVRAILSAAARQRTLLPLGVALSIVQSVCRGLHFAHDCSGDDGAPLDVVHRDVSPANVIVTYDGSTKLLDFGVAKASSHTRETVSGTLKGKIGYMSPEQCLGEPLDRRSDVFAIGILLFELTTGTRLFRDDAEFKMLMRIVQEDAPAPATRRDGYPAELDFIVRRALARDRSVRYASARDVERDLAAFVRAAAIDDSPSAVADFMAVLFPQAASEQPPFATLANGSGPFDVADDPSIMVIPGSDAAAGSGDAARSLAVDLRPARLRRLQVAIAAVALTALAALGIRSQLGSDERPPARMADEMTPASAPVQTPDRPRASAAAAVPTADAVAETSADADDRPDDPATADPAGRRSSGRHRHRGSGRRSRGSTRGAGTPASDTPPAKKASWDPDSALLPSL